MFYFVLPKLLLRHLNVSFSRYITCTCIVEEGANFSAIDFSLFFYLLKRRSSTLLVPLK